MADVHQQALGVKQQHLVLVASASTADKKPFLSGCTAEILLVNLKINRPMEPQSPTLASPAVSKLDIGILGWHA